MSGVSVRPTRLRQALVVRGVVQGVGFRPHVARLAAELDLAGTCRNDATCVVIEVEGLADEEAADARHLHLSGYPLLHEGSRAAGLAALAAASGRGLTTSVDAASAAP